MPGADLSRLPIALDLRAISIAEGVRAALAVAVIVALSGWLAAPGLMQAALAALFTCMCDPGGPVSRRVPALLSFTFLGAATLCGFGFLRAFGYAAIPFACFAVFAFSFARIYGQAAQQVGALATVVLVLALDRPWPDAATAFASALLFIAGGLWAVLLTLVIWRLHPYRPTRRAVAEIYRALALLAADLRRVLAESDTAAWDAHARAHRRLVRDAIEQARGVVLATLRQRGAQSPRAAQSLIRLEAAEQIFAALIALDDILQSAREPARRQAAAKLLRRVAPLLATLARGIVRDRITAPTRMAQVIAALPAPVAGLAPDDPIRRIATAIVDRLTIALTVTLPAGLNPGATADGSTPPLLVRIRAPLVANFATDSAALRHALRTALVAAPALAITFFHGGSYQHWLTITLVLTMQPYFAVTLQRALERIAGTVIGGFLASLLALVLHSPWQLAAALFPLTIAAMAVRVASFGLYIMLLTPLIVLLLEIGHAGTSGLEIAIMRAVYTLLGGLLAVAGVLVLWPSWEPERVRGELAAALSAHARYAEATLAFLLAEAGEAHVEAARRAAGIASNNLEASLARALHEPHRRQRARLETALLADAALRRLAGRLAAMRLAAAPIAAADHPTLAAWRAWIGPALDALAAGAIPATPAPYPPNDPTLAEALGRIARQIDLIAGARRRASASFSEEKEAKRLLS
ncbi:MAG: FUSC family protein [Acidibrevibacterium sp.]|uniref:FUSC family protein n=1 Tax=Acidibrevibacterium sp. TaxID=2606776 RepID=UPI003CFF84DA